MRRNQIQWAEERVELLRKMWSEGATVDAIAASLGTTRSAVAGMIYRLRRAAAALHLEAPARRRPSRRTGRRKSVGEPPGASLLLLTTRCCRWPDEKEKAARFFCKEPGADLERGLQYCPRHMKRAYPTAEAVE